MLTGAPGPLVKKAIVVSIVIIGAYCVESMVKKEEIVVTGAPGVMLPSEPVLNFNS